MAFDASTDQSGDDEDQKNQAGQTAGAQTQSLSGGGGGFAGQSGASQTGAPGSYDQKPTDSGSWTNLNSYLSANADQAPGIGQGIANMVGNQASQTQNDLSSVQQGFQNQAPYQALNNTTTADVDQAFSNPSQYSAAGADVTTPENYLNNGWALPTGGLESYGAATTNADGTQTPSGITGPAWSDVANDFTTANQNLQDTQSESGRGVLLQNQYGQNGQQYNQGEQGFDQLLLEQNPQNQSALNSVYNQYAPTLTAPAAGGTTSTTTGGLPLAEYNALQGAQTYQTNEANQALAYQTQATGDLNNQISGLGSTIGGEVSADSASTQDAYQKMLNDLQSGKLTSDEASGLGITGPTHIYNENLGSYVSPLNNVYAGSQGANYAALQPDWANYAGLQNLVGGMNGNGNQVAALGNVGLTGTAATQATAPANTPYTYQAANLQKALSLDQNTINSELFNPGPGGVGAGLTPQQLGLGSSYSYQQLLDAINSYYGGNNYASIVNQQNTAPGQAASIVGSAPAPSVAAGSDFTSAQSSPQAATFPQTIGALEKDQNAQT